MTALYIHRARMQMYVITLGARFVVHTHLSVLVAPAFTAARRTALRRPRAPRTVPC